MQLLGRKSTHATSTPACTYLQAVSWACCSSHSLCKASLHIQQQLPKLLIQRLLPVSLQCCHTAAAALRLLFQL
mgnify:CR=1 FL=1